MLNDACCPSYTEQEQILLDATRGRENPHRATHKRLFDILETFDGMAPVMDIERARLFTASMKTTEGQPLMLRWAKALHHIAEHITVYIDDNQLLVGRCGTDKGRYGILYPELDGDFMAFALQSLSERRSAAPIHVDPEDARIVAVADAKAVLRQEGEEFAEGLRNVVDVLIKVQMIRFDVEHDGDGRTQMQKAGVEFTRFGEECVAAADTRAAADRVQLPADVNGRIEPRLHRKLGEHGGRRRLAVRAAYADRSGIALHKLPQQRRALHAGYAKPVQCQTFGVVRGDRRRIDDEIRAFYVLRPVAD